MEWRYDTTTRMYILTVGAWRCQVWRMGNTWVAIVANERHAITTGGCETANEAKTWCLERLAEFRAKESDSD